MILLDPKHHDRHYPDERSREVMRKTIAFFEEKGKRRLKEDDRERVWYADFLEFVEGKRIFATLLHAGRLRRRRLPLGHLAQLRVRRDPRLLRPRLLVHLAGLGPRARPDLDEPQRGDQAAHGARCSRRAGSSPSASPSSAHGADIYSTEMALTPQADGTLPRQRREVLHRQRQRGGDRLDLRQDRRHAASTSSSPSTPSTENYELHPERGATARTTSPSSRCTTTRSPRPTSCSRGEEAWDAALNTVNIGKYNLGWASIGICTHALYEAIHHAAHRSLYGMRVTDFPHVRQLFTDAYARLVAMKLFALRAADYMRSASPEDRRYLLYNPVVKMKVTTQGEDVINLLWDVIAAKGFEKDIYFEMAARDIRALPKLEGTVHVNIALIVKFMPNYFFNPPSLPGGPAPRRRRERRLPVRPGPDQGARADPLPRLRARSSRRATCPTCGVFREQIAVFKELLDDGHPGREPGQGHRLPAGARRDLHAGRLRAAPPRERGDLRHRRRRSWTRSSTSWCATSRARRSSCTASRPARPRRWSTACACCASRWRTRRPRPRCGRSTSSRSQTATR